MTSPPSISFEVNGKPLSITLPEPEDGSIRSIFIVGLPKAGSTLMNRIMTPLCRSAGLVPFSLHNTFRTMGLSPAQFPKEAQSLFIPRGYNYNGFRGWDAEYAVPRWASGRTILMVRDPRDMIVSQYYSEAFSHKPPGSEADDALAKRFEERRKALQDQSVEDYVIANAATVRRGYLRTVRRLDKIDYKTWRYEDIVFDKLRWTKEMLDYLQLSAPAELIETTVEKFDIKPSTEQVDQHVRRVTPGDHRNKLSPGTIKRLNNAFSEILERYGYSAD